MNKQKIFIAVLVVVLLGIGYNFYRSSQTAPSPTAGGGNDLDLVQDLPKLRKLKESKLDVSIFQRDLFKNLESGRGFLSEKAVLADLPPELQPGKANPFQPLQTQAKPGARTLKPTAR